MFTDQVHIMVQAGSGGNGCDSYYHRTDRKSVPHGGDGGRGGRVIFRADRNVSDLESFRFSQHFVAESGGNGGSDKKRGKNGNDLLVLVPVGTKILDKNRNLLIRHLTESGQEVILLEGGAPGQGNLGGKLSTPGERGKEIEVELQLRIPADVFLIGLPNAGKSALMNKLTRTHLKEEAYPFSTRQPEMGVWMQTDYESLKLCELPSLYEGSHEGRGLGADFLKHLEGAPYLFYMIDPVSQFAETLSEGYGLLRAQLESYSEDFLEIPHAVIVGKIDLPEAEANLKKKFNPGKGIPVFYISSVTGEGMKDLVRHLKKRWTVKGKNQPYAGTA